MVVDEETKKRLRLNADERRALKAADISSSSGSMGERHSAGRTHDRRYDGRIARRVGRMSPIDLDSFIRDDEP